MVIKILGTGCTKCKATIDVVEKVSKELNINPTILKVEDMQEIMKYDILSTPAVVIDEVVRIKGKVPTADEIKGILTN
jgi:small redox-active disulfide protein 2